jgi:hypothetical protein
MEESHPIGAGHDAVPASDAPLSIHEDNPFRRLIGCTNRADLHTGRLGALVAEFGDKKCFIYYLPFHFLISPHSQIYPAGNESIPGFLRRIGEDPAISGDDIPLHPGPGHIGIEGDLIFELTGLDAETTTNAFVGIHEKYPADRR